MSQQLGKHRSKQLILPGSDYQSSTKELVANAGGDARKMVCTVGGIEKWRSCYGNKCGEFSKS